MGKGGKGLMNGHTKEITWDEIKTHDKKDDSWVVINGKVYNVTNFMKKHPGGARIIASYGGQDATDAYTAMHNNKELVEKYMKTLFVGEVATKQSDVMDDFRELRKYVEKSGLLKVDPIFYIVYLAHLIALDLIGYFILYTYGAAFIPYMAAVLCFATCQAQAGWVQHDYGHLSVFNNTTFNHIVQQFIIGFIKGASADWWNFRHSIHHVKPNILKKDPDINMGVLFLLGDVQPKIVGERKKGALPYQIQHVYFFFFIPLLLPLYFTYDYIRFAFGRKKYWDIFNMSLFWLKLLIFLGPIVGFWGAIATFFVVRTFESYWFVWCTQMSHIPNEIDFDHEKDWFRLQLDSTCNVEPGLFNDWFSGHLNYQIEHHLFPTMPRHNFHKVTPFVKSMCKKYGVNYRCKTLWTAFGDIVRSLATSGEIWYNAYYEI